MTRRTNPLTEKRIVDMYNDGIGTLEIARNTNLSRPTIQAVLIRNNIYLRKTSPWKNKYDVHFFDNYTPETCYWAGFILADGYVRPNRSCLHIKLSLKDEDHLILFKNTIRYTGELHKHENYAYINMNGKWYTDALRKNFEIVPHKTMTAHISEKIPDKMLSHFIRGYFDGDGCVTLTSTLAVSFVCGSRRLIEQLRFIFYYIGVRLKSRNIFPPICKNNTISYSGKNASIILDWLYTDSNESMRMERKYKRYLELW